MPFALWVHCAECDADPGQPCRTPSGRAVAFYHVDRHEVVVDITAYAPEVFERVAAELAVAA